jgi:hypothetical protein
LDQLVAPIALYPDALVAQVLAASSYPAEVVEAARWMRQNSSLQGQALAQQVDQQSWDPSVKALTQFPSVLQNMSKNLSWTSALGDAYVSQQQSVVDAVQTMRQRAQSSGNLKSTPQQTVTTQGQTIVIEPANPDLVYVPHTIPGSFLTAGLTLLAPFPDLASRSVKSCWAALRRPCRFGWLPMGRHRYDQADVAPPWRYGPRRVFRWS